MLEKKNKSKDFIPAVNNQEPYIQDTKLEKELLDAIDSGDIAAAQETIRTLKGIYKSDFKRFAVCNQNTDTVLTPFQYAVIFCHKNKKEMLSMMMKETVRMSFLNEPSLVWADSADIPLLVSLGENVNCPFARKSILKGKTHIEYMTPLVAAAQDGDIFRVRHLLAAGANTKDMFAHKAVLKAVDERSSIDNQIACLQALSEAGINILWTKKEHSKPAIFEQGHLDPAVVKWLIEFLSCPRIVCSKQANIQQTKEKTYE